MRPSIHRYEYLTFHGAAGTVTSIFSKIIVRAQIATVLKCPQTHVVIREVTA